MEYIGNIEEAGKYQYRKLKNSGANHLIKNSLIINGECKSIEQLVIDSETCSTIIIKDLLIDRLTINNARCLKYLILDKTSVSGMDILNCKQIKEIEGNYLHLNKILFKNSNIPDLTKIQTIQLVHIENLLNTDELKLIGNIEQLKYCCVINKLDISQTKIRKLAGGRISKGDIIKLKTNGFIKSENIERMSSMFRKDLWTDSRNDVKKIFDDTYFWCNLAPNKELRGYASIHDTGLFD